MTSAKPDIGFVFDLEPKKAIEFLQSKKVVLNGVDDVALLTSARQRAARIANLSSLEMTKDIYQSLADSRAKGQSMAQWKAEMFDHFKAKGWVVGRDKDFLIADPKTGELFGTPRRLDTIYRTNTQAAYSAQRYQQMMDNIDSRPFWQYSAVGDSRTRPSHQSLSGLIYRYDDPFWSVFYPPNGFNCRCSVIALAQRDIDRRNLVVGDGTDRLVEHTRQIQPGVSEKTKAFKVSTGKHVITDRGFDYNIGRTTYKPRLDDYPEALAHQFAKKEMGGVVFKQDYQAFEKEVRPFIPKIQAMKDKGERDIYLRSVRNALRKEYKFAAGVLNEQSQLQMKAPVRTVWLSDDTLLKQIVNRESQNYTTDDYAVLPDLLNNPSLIEHDRDNTFRLYKKINDKRLVAAIKIIEGKEEVFLLSMRIVKQNKWKKLFGKEN